MKRWRPFLKGAELEEALAGDDAPPRNSLDYYPELLRRHRAKIRALWRRVFVVVIVATGVWLVLAQKQDVMINDVGLNIDARQEWTLKCPDGTHGTFIGDKIMIDGCEVQPTQPVR